MSKKINKIYTYGSSFTKGGGFEFHLDEFGPISDFYKKTFPEEEFTQFNYSWPGQLKKLINSNSNNKISVINEAQSGYGYERVIRRCTANINENYKNLSETLFLIEFPSMGRKEYWYRPINDYIITNFHYKIEGSEDEFNFVINDDKVHYDTHTHGIASTYHIDDEETKDVIRLNKSVIEEFNSITLDFPELVKKMSSEILNFLSFLDRHDINYLIVTRPFLNMDFEKWYKGYEKREVHYIGDSCDIWYYFSSQNLDIKTETGGISMDGHASLIGNKNIASIIHKKILEEYEF